MRPTTAATTLGVTLALSLAAPAIAQAQERDSKRAYASRTELQAALDEIGKVLNSAGYSERLKSGKRTEGTLIRQRLTEGDIQVGDEIVLLVEGATQFSDTFTVGPDRTLTLPGTPMIPLKGVLRSETETYLTEQLERVIRSPVVQVQPLIRVSVLGQIGRPGFYQLQANMPITDAIMAAGGPLGQTDPTRSYVRRGGQVIITSNEFSAAVVGGQTLDDLNLQAGDEIVVERIRNMPRAFSILTIIGLVTSITYFIANIVQ